MDLNHISKVPDGTRLRRAQMVCCAFALFASIAGATAASAAPCTNTLTPSDTTPGGFAAAFNLLSTAKEPLIQGTECAASVAQVKVGSGSAEQYIYKNALYWTGSEWKELPLSGASLVSDTWFKGSAAGSMPIAETPRYVLGYVCQRDNGKWKCGCSDQNCSTPVKRHPLLRVKATPSFTRCRATGAAPGRAL